MRSGSLRWPPRRRIIFTEEAKELLRKPAGKLVKGDPRQVAETVKSIIEFEEAPLVIAIGDYTSSKLREVGARINLFIIDGRVERKKAAVFNLRGMNVIEVENEAGTLNPDAVKTLHKLLRRKGLGETVLKVNGEEDLLTLAAILSAPDRALIIYGQPGEGSVVIKVGDAIRELASKILRLTGYR